MGNTQQIDRPKTRMKSPLELARRAMAEAGEAIPQYSSRFSRHDYTQHQLYALVALRRLLKTDYRGLEATLRDWTELREALGLVRVPDHSTIQRAARRLEKSAKARRAVKRASTSVRPGSPLPLFDRTEPAEAAPEAPGPRPDAEAAVDSDSDHEDSSTAQTQTETDPVTASVSLPSTAMATATSGAAAGNAA